MIFSQRKKLVLIKKKMIPNIFISSTISDLSHLRDSIRDVVAEIGYNPIMSEYGDIGYLPSESAEDSCYIAMRDCQLSIVIIGKRYGSISENGLSVTHNEYKTARDKKIPVIFLVNEEVLSYKKVYDANEKGKEMNFPGMENHDKIFELIREFSESKFNNGLIGFSNVQSAKGNLKKQLAHIVGDLLKRKFDPVQSEIKDILSEIITLRHILLKNEQKIAREFSLTFRFLLEEENSYLKDSAEVISGSLENAVPELIKENSFKDYLKSQNVELKELDTKTANIELNPISKNLFNEEGLMNVHYSMLPHSKISTRASLGSVPEYDVEPISKEDNQVIFGIGRKKFWCNHNAMRLMEAMFARLKKVVTESDDK